MIGISCVRIGSVSLFIGQVGKVVVVGKVILMSEWPEVCGSPSHIVQE